jgi:hypothetical protein
MTEERKALKISRRKLLLGTGVGALFGANVVAILVQNAASRAKSAKLKFQGPFSYGQELPVENRKESPVTTRSICFSDEELGNYLSIEFSFNGEKDPRRKIDLLVTGKDSVGTVIVRDHVVCNDARIPRTDRPICTKPEAYFLVNMLNISLDRITPEQISQLEVAFAE